VKKKGIAKIRQLQYVTGVLDKKTIKGGQSMSLRVDIISV